MEWNGSQRFEPSTRTNLPQMAAHRLGLHVLNFDAPIQVSKGSLCSILCKQLKHWEQICNRSSEDWPAMELDKKVNISLVNAGSGVRIIQLRHIDALTIKQHWLLPRTKVTIVGDILHSRVARSNIDV